MNSMVAWAVLASFLTAEPVVVGSKKFAESVTLGEMAKIVCQEAGAPAEHRPRVGGTLVVWDALLAGEIDLYPEYTGTLISQILAEENLNSEQELREALARRGVKMTAPLGFRNDYVIGVREQLAKDLNIAKISDLRKYPNLRLAFSNEFLQRDDGWKSLRDTYQLPQRGPRGMAHALAYRALDNGDIDVMDTYMTDAQTLRHDLRLLEDDLEVFPLYKAVFVYRADLQERTPEAVAAIKRLEGKISTEEMLKLNALVELEGREEERVAGNFLARQLDIGDVSEAPNWQEDMYNLAARLGRTTWQHLFLVVTSLAMAIAAAIPLGVAAAKRPSLSHLILSGAEIVQTIPGLALLAFLMPPVRAIGLRGTGAAPVIAALFLYSLLPIIRNTYTGLQDIPRSLRESAEALGLSRWEQLWHIELPLAARMILAGIKTTAVIIVGYATLGALIGAGGYGDPILAGMDAGRVDIMMEGAIPAALLALAAKVFFEWSERLVVPQGLRL